jgi:hypothetical protein
MEKPKNMEKQLDARLKQGHYGDVLQRHALPKSK